MVPKSDHLANPRFDKKPSAQVQRLAGMIAAQTKASTEKSRVRLGFQNRLTAAAIFK